MGKPSLKSRKSSRIRKKNRKVRMIKEFKKKEEEVFDLQVQMQDFKKTVLNAGEIFLNKFEQCSRENKNLVEWLKVYDKQMKDYEKEIYDLNLRLYFSQPQQQKQKQPQSSQQQPRQPQHQPPHQPQQHQPQQHQPQQHQPRFSSLADYFKSQSHE